MVIDAADASRVHAPEKKCISRATDTGWWRNQIALFAAETRRTIKVYRVRSEEFFSEFHRGAGTSDNRTVSGWDVEFDGGEWRCREIVDHLLDWIPEVVPPHTILTNPDQPTAPTLLPRAVEACKENGG